MQNVFIWKKLTFKGNLRQVFIRVYRLEIGNFLRTFSHGGIFQPSIVICTLLCCPTPLLSGSTLPPSQCEYSLLRPPQAKTWNERGQTPAAKSLYRSIFRWQHFALPSMSLPYLSTCLTILFSLSLLQVCTQNPVGVYFTAFLNYVNIGTSCPRICVILREVIRYPLQKVFLYREQNIILRANIFHYIPLLGLCGTEDSHRVSEWSPEPDFLNLLRSPGIDTQLVGQYNSPELEFLKSLWGLGTEEE